MASTTTKSPLLRMSGITKRFPGTLALEGVDMVVDAGEIHGLVGENGAGKSTLLRILAGDYRPSSGKIEIDGEAVEINGPRRARELGIGIVYQELSLLPNLSVAENISLAKEPGRGLRIDERALHATAQAALSRMGIPDFDANRKVGDLSLAERHLVEIAKALALQGSRILVLDEPTAALGHVDVERLFGIARSLSKEGVALIFVSHRYREVLSLCDRSTVLRNGRVVGSVDRDTATLDRLVDLTLGQSTESAYSRTWRATEPGEVVLETRGLSVGELVRSVDLTVRRGEIVGLCGLLGSGQNELARALAGDSSDVSGTISIKGSRARPRSPRGALRLGLAMISENRQEEGLFPDLTVRRNISIASLSRIVYARYARIIARRKERSLTGSAATRTGLANKALSRRVRVLSGGNQQKSLLARWLMRRCDVLAIIEPTRGVDIGAKLEIYGQLESLARDGTGMLVVSTDIPEVMALADVIAVMFEGSVVSVLDPRKVSEQDVLLAMQGGLETLAASPRSLEVLNGD